MIREYPRLSTTVIDAYVGPTIERYLVRLEERLTRRGRRHAAAFPDAVERRPDAAVDRRAPSQPDAAVRPGRGRHRRRGACRRKPARRHVVTFDMGGTSTDISVIADGRMLETTEGEIAGQDIGTPMLKVRTLGAGGGTIAAIGKDGLLKVGPAQRRRRAGSGLLWPRRRGAHRHRRQSRARRALGRDACSPAPCALDAVRARRALGADRRAAGARCGRRGHGHPAHRQHADGGRSPARASGAGTGPAPLRARRLRRRRAAARRLSRAQRRHPDRAGAALSRPQLRHGHAADRGAPFLSALARWAC